MYKKCTYLHKMYMYVHMSLHNYIKKYIITKTDI